MNLDYCMYFIIKGWSDPNDLSMFIFKISIIHKDMFPSKFTFGKWNIDFPSKKFFSV